MNDFRHRIVDFQYIRAGDILPNPNNWRTHSESQKRVYRAMVDDIGYVGAQLVYKTENGDLMLVDGHMRADIHPDELLPTLITDLTEDEADNILATFDPISALAEANKAKVAALHKKLAALKSNVKGAREKLLKSIREKHGVVMDDEETIPDPGSQIDRADELQEKWQVQRGDVWEIPSVSGEGVHRVMCGDSIDMADVEMLMGGVKADLMLTDPPYGIKMDKGFGGFGGFGKPIARRQYNDEWDVDRPTKEVFEFMISIAEITIIFGGNFFTDLLPVGRHWLVWDKNNTMPTFGDCELAWTNINRKSVKKYEFTYNGLIGKEKERFHPTQKPAGLFVLILNDYTEPGDLIVDPYLGSGTTIVACEQTGRVGYGMELHPPYVSVTLERLEAMGLSPRNV